MFESHHIERLFPNVQKLPGLTPHLDAARAELSVKIMKLYIRIQVTDLVLDYFNIALKF